MTPTLDTGLVWVEKRMRELPKKSGRSVGRLKWPRTSLARADEIASYRMLKEAYCEYLTELCEINRPYLAGKSVPDNLLPDGTMEV